MKKVAIVSLVAIAVAGFVFVASHYQRLGRGAVQRQGANLIVDRSVKVEEGKAVSRIGEEGGSDLEADLLLVIGNHISDVEKVLREHGFQPIKVSGGDPRDYHYSNFKKMESNGNTMCFVIRIWGKEKGMTYGMGSAWIPENAVERASAKFY